MEKKIIVERRNSTPRRLVEGVAVGFGIALGLELPGLFIKLIIGLF